MVLQRSGLVFVLLLVLLAGGCAEPPVEPAAEVVIVPHISEEVRGKLLEGAITILDRLENYDEALELNYEFELI